MTQDQIRTIERLREAAKAHGEVSDLLDVLSTSLSINDGDRSVVADESDLEYLRAVLVAAAFVQYDQGAAEE